MVIKGYVIRHTQNSKVDLLNGFAEACWGKWKIPPCSLFQFYCSFPSPRRRRGVRGEVCWRAVQQPLLYEDAMKVEVSNKDYQSEKKAEADEMNHVLDFRLHEGFSRD